MTDDRSADLVTTWLHHSHISTDAHFLDRLVRYNAETGWRLILAVHRLSKDPELHLSYLVERLLRYHGDTVIERIVNLATTDAGFRSRLDAMQHTYGVRDDLVRRVGAVAGWTPRVREKNPVIKSAEAMLEVDINPPTDAEAWADIDAERSDGEILRLAQAWVENETLQWAFDEVLEVVQSHPVDDAWRLVLTLVDRADSDALGAVAAGPLEDFLAARGMIVMNRVEEKANADPKFRKALRGVWRSGMPDDVWSRVRAARREDEARPNETS